jgi:hypothetical protein
MILWPVITDVVAIVAEPIKNGNKISIYAAVYIAANSVPWCITESTTTFPTSPAKPAAYYNLVYFFLSKLTSMWHKDKIIASIVLFLVASSLFTIPFLVLLNDVSNKSLKIFNVSYLLRSIISLTSSALS